MKEITQTNNLRNKLLSALACVLTAHASAEVVNLNFENVALPSGQSGILTLPYNEQGLRIQPAVNGINAGIYGPTSPRYAGVKAFVPSAFATGEDVVYHLFSPSGRLFAVRSVTLHPPVACAARNVTFTRFLNGGGMMQTHSTGTSLAGNTVTFNSNFDRTSNLEWRHVQVGGIYQSFQISSIVVEFDGVLSTPPQIVAAEAAGTVEVPISLAHPRTSDTVLTREIAAISATSGTDYTLPGGNTNAPNTIPAGQTTAMVSIPIVNDIAAEGIEKLRVTFTSNSVNAAFAGGATSGMCEVSIASDDGITAFPDWMTAHGLTNAAAAPGADPNADGISNVECWLFRLNPAGPNPQAWLSRRASFSGGSADPGLTFFVPTPLPNDVSIVFSQSTALDAWSEQARRTGFGIGSLWQGSGSSRVIESTNLVGRTITLRGSVPTGPRPRLFLRNTYQYVPNNTVD